MPLPSVQKTLNGLSILVLLYTGVHYRGALMNVWHASIMEVKMAMLPAVKERSIQEKSVQVAQLSNAIPNIQILIPSEQEMKNVPGVVSLERDPNSNALKITLSSDRFFLSGTASLKERSEPKLKEIVELLKTAHTGNRIEIEGYTDSSPIVKQKKVFRSNWELSLARAASVVHAFEEAGFAKDHLKVIGFGDSRPNGPDAFANRRIILRVFHEGSSHQPL